MKKILLVCAENTGKDGVLKLSSDAVEAKRCF
jgi:hypothetical protein